MHARKRAISRPDLVQLETALGPLLVPLRIERSPRARTMRMFVNHAREVVLRLPGRQSLRSAEIFLHKHSDWLRQTLEAMPRRPDLLTHLKRHGFVSAHGRSYGVYLAFSSVEASFLFFPEAGEVCFRMLAGQEVEDELYALLRRFAAQVLPERVKTLGESCGLQVKRVSVRDQSTRWGSCSTSGTLSLNWRLVLLPPALQDHIIYHELAHVSEMNHSKRFYALLARLDPDAERHSSEISRLCPYYMALGR